MTSLKQKISFTWQKSISALYQVLGNNLKALNMLESLAGKGYAGEYEWWSLGVLYLRLQQWDKAVRAFLNAVRISDGNPKYIFWLGRVEEQAGNSKAAEALYDQVIKKDADFWEAYAAKAQLFLDRAEYQEALVLFTECLKYKPEDPDLLNNVGLCFLGLNELHGARQYLADAVQRKPGDGHIRYNFATVLIRFGDYDNALLQLFKLKDKGNAPVQMALGYCFGMLKEYEESINCYLEALRLEPGNQEAMKNLAAIYAQDKQFKQALQLMKDLLRINPQDAELLNNMAWIHEAMAQYPEAEKNYYRGLVASGGSPEIAHNLIFCLKRQKKLLEALDLVKYLEKKPEQTDLYWSALAQIYEDFEANNLAVDC